MQSDPASWLCSHPRWKPSLEQAAAGDFRMTDLLTHAGVDPASRGQ